jgi:M6 family metalloprotease-like protein
MSKNPCMHRPGRALRRVAVVILMVCGVAASPARAGDMMQGVLQITWGDAPRMASGSASSAPQPEVWLDAGPGHRYRLDADQARRAAGDLYALANRRVAVSYTLRRSNERAGYKALAIDAIVPADRLSKRALEIGVDGRGVLSVPLQGNTRWITLMCKFADVDAEQKPRAFFQSQYGTAPGQLGHFWSEVSYGHIDLAGSAAHGWYTLPRPRSSYVATIDGKPKADLSLLFADCTAMADPEVDFHGIQGVNLMFNDELDGYAWGGGACASMDGIHACPRATWNPPWSFLHLAAMAHEMGHGYGLPHSNNSDGDGDTFDNPWDLMSDAWRMADSDATYGLLPKHLNMVQRQRLGWVTAARTLVLSPEDVGTYDITLDTASLQDAGGVQLLVLALPAQPDPFATVVYAVEARRRGGRYESRLAGDAVIIHRVNDYGIAYSMDTDVPPADHASNEGSMLKPGERWTMPDGQQSVEVVAETADGFVVRVGPRRRVMSSPLPALVRPAVTGVAATPVARDRMPGNRSGSPMAHDPPAAEPARRNVQVSACAARPCATPDR